jgi:OmpA-OmpF porin, OOP family
MSLMDDLRKLVTPDLLTRASALLGESEPGTSRALSAAFSTMLAALADKSADGGALRQIMDLLGDRAIDSNVLRNPASLLAGGLAKSPMTEVGGRFLSTLFGGQTSTVASALADYAGIKSSSASTLLGLAAPLVMGLLGDRVRRDGLGATGLQSLLSAERADIASQLPAALGRLAGFGSAARATAEATTHRTAERRPSVWIPATFAALLLLGGLWAYNRTRAPERIAAIPPQPPRMANAVVTGVDAGQFTRKLPNAYELSAPATGIEEQIVVFIEDPGKTVDTAAWFNFDRLLFETGSAVLKPESKAQLQNVAQIMKAYPNVKAKVGGYTDNTGDSRKNLKLSQDRAASVVTELVALGVAPDRLTSEGYGDQHPVADNGTDEGRRQNRRIAMRITEK